MRMVMRAKRITNTADRCSWRGERPVRARLPGRLLATYHACSLFQTSSGTTSPRKASSSPLSTAYHSTNHTAFKEPSPSIKP